MSSPFDVTGTGEKGRKGNMPKEESSCSLNLGHAVKNCMTVIYVLDGALSVVVRIGIFR